MCGVPVPFIYLVLVTERLMPERMSGLKLTGPPAGAPIYVCAAAAQN